MLCAAIHVFQAAVNFYEEHIERKDYDYSKLPPYIIAKILSHLHTDEFRNASVACKSWYFASSDPQVAKNIRVNLRYESTNCNYLVRPIYILRLNSINWNKLHYRRILKKFGSTVTDLEIISKITVTQLLEIFIYLPNVRSLTINDGSRGISVGNFERSRKIVKHKDVIARNLAQIKKIYIWTEVQDLKLYRIFLSYCINIDQLYVQRPWGEGKSYNDFLFDYLLNPTLNIALRKMIDLKFDNLDRKQNSKFFEKITNLKLTNVKRLTLCEISTTYYDVMFRDFCKTYNFLESLSLTGCNGQQLADICKYIKNLKKISLGSCTANNLSQILNIHCLEELIISRVDLILDDDLLLLFSSQHKILKQLEICQVDLNLLNLICENCKNLESLTVNEMLTQDCEPIFRNLTHLKKLNLAFREPPQMNSRRMKSSNQYNITNLTKLEELYISCYVPGITPVLIERMPKINETCLYVWDPSDADLAQNWNSGEVDDDWENNDENDNLVNDDDKTVIYNISDFSFFGNCDN